MIRLHRPGLILAGIAVTLLNVAVTVPANASSSVRPLPPPGDPGTLPAHPVDPGPHDGRRRHGGLADRLDRDRGIAARGDSRRAGLPGMDDPGQAASGSAVSTAFG